MRNFRIQGVLVFGLLICFSVIACNPFLLRESSRERIRSQEIRDQVFQELQIGMSRNEVESIANEHAWIQYKCILGINSIDIYLFGSHNPEWAGILKLNYRLTEGVEYLDNIFTFESYFLEGNTAGCEETLLP